MKSGIITTLVILSLGILGPNLAQAHCQEYNDGYATGQSYAKQGLSIDTEFLNSHSKNWQAGFNDGWNSVSYSSGNTQQSQSNSINIKGNNNRVTVNQG